MNTKSDNDSLNPAIPDSIVALATRIERAMRACFVFVAPTELDAQAYTDMETITDGVNDGVRRGEKRPIAARAARITWLAGVLAGAMGRAEQPKGDVGD